MADCATCNGTGEITCPECNWTGTAIGPDGKPAACVRKVSCPTCGGR